MKILGVKDEQKHDLRLFSNEPIDNLPPKLFGEGYGALWTMCSDDARMVVIVFKSDLDYNIAVEKVHKLCLELFNVEPIYA